MKAVEELNALKEEYFVSDLNRVKPRHTLDLNSGVKINKAESVDTISEIQEELRQQVARQHENAVNPVPVPVMERLSEICRSQAFLLATSI